jgi:hypothetical protein
MKVPASIEAASRFMGPRQGRVYACPSVLAFALFMILVVPTELAPVSLDTTLSTETEKEWPS